jgi:hypothetical protein
VFESEPVRNQKLFEGLKFSTPSNYISDSTAKRKCHGYTFEEGVHKLPTILDRHGTHSHLLH